MNFNINLGGNGGFGMNSFQQIQPVFKQISVGQGINQQEYNSIITACKQAYMNRITPFSTYAGRSIKQYLGGEWLVVCSNVNNNNFDFSLTSVTGGDFIAFSLDSTLFQVCRLKNF